MHTAQESVTIRVSSKLADEVRRLAAEESETKSTIIRRLLRRRGISWAFRHCDDGPNGGLLMHSMMLFVRGQRFELNRMFVFF